MHAPICTYLFFNSSYVFNLSFELYFTVKSKHLIKFAIFTALLKVKPS